jgi:hypothetical protein
VKSRLVALLIEVETDAPLALLEHPGAVDLVVTGPNGSHSHAASVRQVDANVVRHDSPVHPPAQP